VYWCRQCGQIFGFEWTGVENVARYLGLSGQVCTGVDNVAVQLYKLSSLFYFLSAIRERNTLNKSCYLNTDKCIYHLKLENSYI